MNDSFTASTSTLTKPPTTKKKYPTQTPPNDTWTIEQLLHWSLDQYHSAAISRTNSHLEALQAQCENECEDVMTLHELAVGMRERGELNNNDNEGELVESSREEENADPQQQQLVEGDYNSSNHLKPASTSAAATNSTNTTSKPKSATTITNTSTLTITILTGPHESQTYKLQPKHTQPCLIGRSKGKKFLRNGISLSKDQEVSTTHGKFSIEQQVVGVVEDGDNNNNNDGSSNSGGGVQNKFYYTDVGSTNGSTVGEARLEPNVRIEIEEGMDLRVGNSALKIEFG
ncbi:hypothetical protein QTG54_006256 [Skeletonema marinoi]|uniref:FHA domain-containing protein n=1 Tax=Skeletonema marinoi TaxID=267567 RepID=A0AAD8YA73_9STRA|nr:hypothetical protein QTG54_006256 [Skeletonema marinoi]